MAVVGAVEAGLGDEALTGCPVMSTDGRRQNDAENEYRARCREANAGRIALDRPPRKPASKLEVSGFNVPEARGRGWYRTEEAAEKCRNRVNSRGRQEGKRVRKARWRALEAQTKQNDSGRKKQVTHVALAPL